MDLSRPSSSEYNDYYAGYVAKAEDDPIAQLGRQMEVVLGLATLGEERAGRPPAAGEWSAKEILGHLCDSERIFAYRALRFARGDRTPLPGFEQEPYVAAAGSNARPLQILIDEFAALRLATLVLFRSFSSAMIAREGTASGSSVSVRALMFITAGHCEGHLADIRRDYGTKP